MGMKSLVAALYNGVTIQVPTNFQMGKDNKSAEFLAMNPNGKVPVLATPEGAIWESNAIFRYVMRANLSSSRTAQAHYNRLKSISGLISQRTIWSCQSLHGFIRSWDFQSLMRRHKKVQQGISKQHSRCSMLTFCHAPTWLGSVSLGPILLLLLH